jgi:hypothetical protein
VRGHGDFLTGNGTEQLGRFGAALGCLTTYPHPTGDRANQISNANCDGTAWPDRERFGRQVIPVVQDLHLRKTEKSLPTRFEDVDTLIPCQTRSSP